MKTYTLFLTKDDEEIRVDLRLDIDGILTLQKKYPGEATPETITSAIIDPAKLVFLFDTALNFRGNENKVKTGKDLYNLLVDNEKGGMTGLWEVLYGITETSGIITGKMASRMDSKVQKMLDGMFDDEDEQGNPTKKA